MTLHKERLTPVGQAIATALIASYPSDPDQRAAWDLIVRELTSAELRDGRRRVSAGLLRRTIAAGIADLVTSEPTPSEGN